MHWLTNAYYYDLLQVGRFALKRPEGSSGNVPEKPSADNS